MEQQNFTLLILNDLHSLLSWEIMGQFHQRSTRSFYVRKLCVQLFCTYVLGLHKPTGAKAARRTLMKLTPYVSISPPVSLSSSFLYLAILKWMVEQIYDDDEIGNGKGGRGNSGNYLYWSLGP
jgi:hypothetical protein